jgi:CubicO group peptidase (beta-lactamase class C family)
MSFERFARTALLAAATSVLVPAAAFVPPALAAPRSPAPPPRPDETAPVGPATGPVGKLSAGEVEGLEVLVTNVMSRMGIPGLSLAIGRDGDLVFANGYGFADMENFVSAKADTTYRLASISKTMTAVLALRLAEEGELDLDEPVRSHCSSFPRKRWPVTSRQLLCHQGGVRHYRDGERPMTRRFTTLEEGLALFKDDPLEFEPDTGILYSTFGYTLLGCVIEGVTGLSFAEALKEAVFVPSGMTRTQPDDLRPLIRNRVRGYARDEQGRLVNAALADMSYKVPGGGLSGTAPDLARFGLALVSGRLLGPESFEEMLTPGRTRGGIDGGLGLGLAVAKREGRREAWQDGNQTGASGMLYLRPDDGLVVAMLTNHEGIAPALLPVTQRLADFLLAKSGAAR